MVGEIESRATANLCFYICKFEVSRNTVLVGGVNVIYGICVNQLKDVFVTWDGGDVGFGV